SARAQREHARNLPAANDLTRNSVAQEPLPLTKRQAVHVALNVVQGAVEIGARVIAANSLPRVEIQAAVIAALEIHRLLPGKGRRDTEAIAEAAVELHL